MIIAPVTYRHAGRRVVITHDEMPANPRDVVDSLCAIAYNESGRYCLGDPGADAELQQLRARGVRLLQRPVYAYIHSGIALSLTPFSCPWDSGQSGVTFCRWDKFVEETGSEGLTDNEIELKFARLALAELKEFEAYLNGDVFEIRCETLNPCPQDVEISDWVLDEDNWELQDSCSQIVGNDALGDVLDDLDPVYLDLVQPCYER